MTVLRFGACYLYIYRVYRALSNNNEYTYLNMNLINQRDNTVGQI